MKSNLKLAYVILLNVIITVFFLAKLVLFFETLSVFDPADSYRIWFEHQKWFLTSFMVFFFLSSFFVTRLKENIIVSFLAGYYLTFGWVLQDYAYDFFIWIKFSSLINFPRFDNNPEFANMSVACVGIFFLICSLILPFYRLRKIMILIYGVMLLGLITFVHQIGPTGLIRVMRADRVATLERLIASTTTYEDLVYRCEILGCLTFEHDFYGTPKFEFPENLNFIRPVMQIEAFRLMDSGKVMQFEPVFNAERNPILLGAKHIEGEITLIVDSEYSDKLWKRMKANFSGIIALAFLVWTYLLYFVVEIHHVNNIRRLRKLSSGKETPFLI